MRHSRSQKRQVLRWLMVKDGGMLIGEGPGESHHDCFSGRGWVSAFADVEKHLLMCLGFAKMLTDVGMFGLFFGGWGWREPRWLLLLLLLWFSNDARSAPLCQALCRPGYEQLHLCYDKMSNVPVKGFRIWPGHSVSYLMPSF